MKKFELIPKSGVGNFRLGERIGIYTDLYDYVYYNKDPNKDYDSDFYDFFGGTLTVYVDENQFIESINCSKYCFYRGINIVGHNFDDFLIEANYDKDNLQVESVYMLVNDKGQTQKVYDLDDLGLQIWVYRKKIVTVIVWNPDFYEE